LVGCVAAGGIDKDHESASGTGGAGGGTTSSSGGPGGMGGMSGAGGMSTGGAGGTGVGGQGGSPPPLKVDCQAPSGSNSMGSCVQTEGPYACNPITNAPCNSAGNHACILNQNGGLECDDPPHTELLCWDCSQAQCAFAYTCVEDADGISKCAKFCCNNSDCSANGHCDLAVFNAPFGICVEGAGGGSGIGGGGAGGAGGN